MQKVINVLALASFAVSTAVVGGGAYVFLNKDNIVEGIKANVTKAVMGAVTDSLPGMLDGAMPELPPVTGGAMPAMPSTTGGVAMPF
jgi:hypothetical protein